MLISLSPMRAPVNQKSETFNDENFLWLAIDSTPVGISHFYEFMDFVKRVWNIDDASFMNIHGALSEAVINSVTHGHKSEEGKFVHIHAHRDEEYYNFSVKDDGEGFNYHRIENPTDIENRTKPGGRGIFIMNYLADNVHYCEGGKYVKLLFRCQRR